MNMKKHPLIELSEKISTPLTAIASPQRIAILIAIGTGEACVCHLETALGSRQAYISQHLMSLRKADIFFALSCIDSIRLPSFCESFSLPGRLLSVAENCCFRLVC